MAHKKVPGFIDKAVETLERKNQGDLTLADEVAEAQGGARSAVVRAAIGADGLPPPQS